jgi:hypothetical protein
MFPAHLLGTRIFDKDHLHEFDGGCFIPGSHFLQGFTFFPFLLGLLLFQSLKITEQHVDRNELGLRRARV